jgi:NitT/TauT family transport system permease protein
MEYKNILKKAGAVLLALAFWQIAAMKIHQKILLVSPTAVLIRLTTIWQVEGFWSSIGFTFFHIAGGFLIGLCTGILLAVLAYKWTFIETLLWPWMVTIKSVPVASFVVICLIWLSSKNLSVFISFLIVLPVIYQNLLTGLRSLKPDMEELAQVYRIPWYRKLKAITLPQLKSYLIAACSVTTGMAWKAGVAAEIIGTPNGSIGKMLYTAKIYLDTDDLLAWTVIIVIMSVLSEKLFLWGLKKVLK